MGKRLSSKLACRIETRIRELYIACAVENESAKRPCGMVFHGFICNRPAGHDGYHVATDWEEICTLWQNGISDLPSEKGHN